MPKMKVPFSDRLLQSLKVRDGSTRTVYWEPSRHGVGALGIRVSSSSKTFVYQYWHNDRSRMMTLGRYPEMSLAEAHQAAGNAVVALERGADPARGLVEENARKREAMTVERLAVEYMEMHAKRKKKTWREDERIMGRDVLPKLGRMRLEDVRRRDIVEMLDDIVLRGAPIAANRCLAVTRKMFNFAVQRGQLEQSPCTLIQAPAKARRRERTLDDGELTSLLAGLPTLPLWTPTALALLVELLTAQRSGEVIAMSWDEVDLDAGAWKIPGSKAKNGRPHLVPIGTQTIRLLTICKRLDMGQGVVFPSRQGGGVMSQTVVARALHRHGLTLARSPFTPHDLRRTAATQMTGIGVSRFVVGKLLNHVDGGVTAIYDRHEYVEKKRDALRRWEKHLGGLGLDPAIAAFEALVEAQVSTRSWSRREERLSDGASSASWTAATR